MEESAEQPTEANPGLEEATEANPGLVQGIIEKVKHIDRRQLFILLLIFILAFGVRAHLMRYDLLFGFDSYWHARIVGYVVQDGVPPDVDPLAYYQLGGAPLGSPSPVFWFLSAFIYKVVTFGAAYDKELWTLFVKVLPAFYGALISVSMFFLLKEMYGKKAGYVGAFFAALVPSFVYRTMASFFEEDSLGFLWLIVGFYFLVKALKNPALTKEHWKNVLLSGIFFGILAWTWGMFLLVPLILTGYGIFTIALMWFRGEDMAKVKAFLILIVASGAVFSVLATAHDGGAWITSMTGYVTQYAPVTAENIERAQTKGPNVLSQSIGEENIGSRFWGTKYNALVIFAFIAPFLALFRVLRKRNDRVSLIIFFWVLITMYMAWNKLKFTYVFGLPIAASAALVFNEVFELVGSRPQFEKILAGVALAFMLLLGVSAGTFFMTQQFPNIEQDNGWKPALYWMNENTPEDAKFFNWWDEGHWITFVGERSVIEDNRNYDFDADRNTGKVIISESEEEAFEIVSGYGSDYVIFSADLLEKQGSLAMYAFNTIDFSDPRLRRYFGVGMRCGARTEGGSLVYQCGSNVFNQQQMAAIPTTWIDTPNQIQDDRMPLFIYTNPERNRLFILNAATNNSMLARLWFNDPRITRFTEVYGNPGVKIFKVNY